MPRGSPTQDDASKNIAAKQGPITGNFADPNIIRQFAHPDGRTYSLEVDGCRVHESWTLASGKGQSNRSTRDDTRSAHAFALGKVRELLNKGYAEGAPRRWQRHDREADVVDAFHSDLNAQGVRRSNFQPVNGQPHVYAFANASVAEWLVTSEDRKLGILVRTRVWQSRMPADTRAALGAQVVNALVDRRDHILASQTTPLRKFPLTTPIGRFTHLVVLSPEVANVTLSRDVNIANPVIARSVFVAFPGFDCEASGEETVALAEARTSGRAALPMNTWDRDPHPVVDLAYVKKAGDPPRFLAFDPRELERRFSGASWAKLDGAQVLHARNHAGQVRIFTRGAQAPDLVELQAFFRLAR